MRVRDILLRNVCGYVQSQGGIRLFLNDLSLQPLDGLFDLTAMVKAQGLQTTSEVVDYFAMRFLSVPLDPAQRRALIAFLDQELATSNVQEAQTWMEDPLRMLLHLIMSMPEYQLG